MSDEQELREVLETNFQLSILFTRQVGERLGQRVDGLGRRMDKLADEMRSVAQEIRGDFEGLADRQVETFEVLRKIGSSSVSIHKELEELKRRVKDLEDKAS